MANVIRVVDIGTPEQLQALGAMTLNFAMVDEFICNVTADLRRFKDQTDYRQHLSELQTSRFCDKVTALRSVIEEMGEQHGVATTDLRSILSRISQLADHRHDIVHGWIEWDEKGHQGVFKNKKKPNRSAAPESINGLAQELVKWLIDFSKSLDSFKQAVFPAMRTLRLRSDS